ncbi:hypothetical protein K2173_006431 [Erythroxylum novogranatense]|uniref:Receptor-like serine/threonine-protein kinase n=1 Tax=Erythroxylum novogranatense TaxID=1862640 RepID=A0AAV8U3C3_9ROSI|nr:hypothetical protein K2173_006431 [Erythroxylum novogranatense]
MIVLMDVLFLLLHSLTLLAVFHFRIVTSVDTLAGNQTISDNGQLLVSKDNLFALGFFSSGSSSSRYLGIWYYGLPDQSVIWVANRDSPINGSFGVLSLNRTGDLILYTNGDQEHSVVWSTNVSMDVKADDTFVAQLLDSGNFVLFCGGKIVWQSFYYPTNSLSKGVRLGLNRKTGAEHFVSSWKSADDPGTGQYSFKLIAGRSPQFVLYKGASPYWIGGPWPWRKHTYIYNYTYVNNQDELYFTYFRDTEEDLSRRIRTVLDETGILRRLTWFESDGKWKEIWSVPKYRCDSYGQCGDYRKCDPSNENKVDCTCPPGYEPKLLKDRILKDGEGICVKKQQESSLLCEQGEGFVKMSKVHVSNNSSAVWLGKNMGYLLCQQQCMSNYSCLAYASVGVAGTMGCLAWYGRLMDSLEFREDGYDLYVCGDALQLVEYASEPNNFLKRKEVLVILAVSVSSAWIVIVGCLFLKRSIKRRVVTDKRSKRIFHINNLDQNKNTLMADELKETTSQVDLAFYDLNTISAATNNFSLANKIGQGGFGSVYKGQLPDGQQVAVKRLSKNSRQGMEEFVNEVKLIAKLQHRNLVKLLGCCIEREEPMLIYEYLINKSLDTFLFDQVRSGSLHWQKRFDIIVGTARGILYLHQDSRLRIIHRDLKTSNVLLDAEMNPKISDFGMARIFEDDQMQDETKKVVGTYGYMSPEYAVFGKFSIKSDVFSFGVIVLEIITGKKINEFDQLPALSLIGYVWELWTKDKALEVVDPVMEESYLPYEALKCIQIALLCVQEDVRARPTMLDAVFMLNNDMPLPYPRQPGFIFHRTYNPSSTAREEGSNSVNTITITTTLAR